MKMPIDKEWFEKRAAAEGDLEIGAGLPTYIPPFILSEADRYYGAVIARLHARIAELEAQVAPKDNVAAAEFDPDPPSRAYVDTLKAEIAELRTGIKRLSDEEELCAETTGDDPFSMVYLAAKLAATEHNLAAAEGRAKNAMSDLQYWRGQYEELAGTSKNHLAGYQERVAAAHRALFHDDPTDIEERRARFAEEANETLQAFGMSREDMHKLVDYTCDRPVGEPRKEIGAALLTLASLCVVAGYDLMTCGEADLEKLRRPETIARIRAKRATRHGRGPLPGFDPASTEGSDRG